MVPRRSSGKSWRALAGSADLVGIGWMVLSGLCFVAVNGIVHHIGARLPAAQSAFIRFLIGLVFFAPLLARSLRRGYGAREWRLFAIRGGLHSLAVALWFFAMARITVAEAQAIGYLNPVAVTLGAALILGERLSWRRGLAIAVAFLGALIVLRPGLRALGAGHLAQIAAALAFGSSYLAAKRLAGLVPAAEVVAMMTLTVTVGLAPLALWQWQPPAMAEIAWLALVAALATLGHYAMTRAFAAAPIIVTQPVVFLQLIWASILGVAVFGDALDPFVLIGGGIMVAAITYITWRESRLRSGAG